MPPAFGGYQVLHQLGSGTLGPVFRAHDPEAGRVVAVKAVVLDLIPEDAVRLADALRALVAVGATHPGIASALDAGLERGTAYLASEFVPGETLDVAFRRLAPASPKVGLALLGQVARALDAAWHAGVGHGMLHPRDIFVLPDGQTTRLTGVGLSWALSNTGIKLPVRRPYTSPERVAGDPWDARADVYALAAIAHELLTGRRPVGPGEQDGPFARSVGREEQAGLRRVLAAGLAADPNERFESATAFVAALVEAAEAGQMALPIADEGDTPVDHHTHDVAPAVEGAVWVVDRAEVEMEPLETDVRPAPPVVAATEPPASGVDWDVDEFQVGQVADAPFGAPAPHGEMPPSTSVSRRWAVVAAVALLGVALGTVAVVLFGPGAGEALPAESTSVEVGPVEQPAALDPGDTEVSVLGDAGAGTPIGPPPSPPAVERPAERAQRVSAPGGQLAVTSRPAGALVMVDGRLRGETPTTLRDLPLGAHTLLVARPGYAPSTQEITLTPASPSRTVSISLQAGLDPRPATRGTIIVDSRPRGARVLVDGRPVGVTPLSLPEMASGRHAVQFELTGYRAVSTSVEVTGGRRSRVAVTLEPAAGRQRR